ncbi:AcfA family outer membrane beta-barrel protein [Vibrio vulnificus]
MKRSLLFIACVCSFPALAAPYIGLEYGFGNAEHETVYFPGDSVSLTPKLDEGFISGYVGLRINQAWAVELGYNQFDLNAQRSRYDGVEDIGGHDYAKETEWETDLDAKQFSVAPVFTHQINHQWMAKFKAGATYTQYKHRTTKEEEYELLLGDHDFTNVLFTELETKNEWGAFVSAGVEYQITAQFGLGANVKYHYDKFMDTTSFNLGGAFYF